MPQTLAKIQLFGPFKVLLHDGSDITPRSVRACALLAILATSQEYERSRRWLESNLWSDRAPEQASGSLRQALMAIRKIFKDGTKPLISNRQIVALAPNIFEIALPLGDPDQTNLEFLEGMHIQDQAFQAWHKEMQTHFDAERQLHMAEQGDIPQRLTIRCTGTTEQSSGQNQDKKTETQDQLLAQHASYRLGQSIVDSMDADCIIAQSASTCAPAIPRKADIDLTCNLIDNGGAKLLMMNIASCHNQQLLYSDTIKLDTKIPFMEGINFHRLGFDAAESVMEKAARSMPEGDPRRTARQHQQRAIREIFHFDQTSLASADHNLDLAYSLEPNPVFLAWKALIRTIQLVERFDQDTEALKMQAQILVEQCLYEGTSNPLVLSLLALVQVMMFGDEDFAVDLATPALEKNPSSAFALQAMAATRLIGGDSKRAYDYSRQSHKIAQGSAFRHWWDLYHCLSCIANNQYEEALKMAEAAARRSPRFRPPLRQLISLYTYFGQTQKAHDAAHKLLYLEPSFDIEVFITNKDYPNRTLRNSGLLALDYEHLRNLP
ncbi:MAG: hypothetical protein OIF56_13600 [Cohaesibacter sp.]|nr:hypothetical protein [Cohaesibacter sp.]